MLGSPGRLGQATGRTSQTVEYVLTWVGRYNKPEQYENIILKANPDGQILRLKDVAQVELGPSYYNIYSNMDGHPSAAIVLKQIPGTNAAIVIENVKKKLEEIKETSFPPGMEFEVSYDVSTFLEASIEQVLHTLLEAFLLVSLVVFMFLGDIRSTLIPTLAVPVSLIGAFFFMQLLGLSINLITLFALVLAIGVVVDDAIVVVEAVHAKMAEKHLSPYMATKEVINEISGAIIAITLVMTAVFVPVTFIPGPVGQFYRQFGITMATSIVLSGVVALTVTPVLCAMILKPHGAQPQKRGWLSKIVTIVVGGVLAVLLNLLIYHLWGWLGLLLNVVPFVRKPFDRAVEKITGGYTSFLGPVVTRRMLTMLVIGGFSVGIVHGERRASVRLHPAGGPGDDLWDPADAAGLDARVHQLQVHRAAGNRQNDRRSQLGLCVGRLRGSDRGPRFERRDLPHQFEALVRAQADLEADHSGAREGMPARCPTSSSSSSSRPRCRASARPAASRCRVLDKTNTMNYKRLGEETEKFLAALAKRKEVKSIFTFFASNYPQYEVVINNDVAMQKGVSIKDAMDNLSIVIGSTWEQGFIRFNQFYKVFVQALPQFRRYPEDFENIFVKNDKGDMVPYSSFMTLKKQQGLNEINRYNLYPSAPIQLSPAPGYSSGQAIAAIKEVAAETLPRGYGLGWEALAYDEAGKGNEAVYIFLIVVVFVYLVLVGQYESFILPLAVIMSLPVGIFGSFFLLQAMGLANDVYCQIGLVMLVGLLGKNAILIVEFAVQRHHEGASLKEAAIEGGKLRFRPILMTSFAFIAGLIPLGPCHRPRGNRKPHDR